MTLALVLVDLQHDYLESPNLQPHRTALCADAARLLAGFRQANLPVFHVWTTIRDDAEAMPHWRASALRRCVEGTPGHSPPANLRPLPGEAVIHKQRYSAFENAAFEKELRAAGAATVCLAGVHLRACVRTTAIDACQRGFSVLFAEEAVGDDDPLHAAVTRQWLAPRAGRFLPVDAILQIAASQGVSTASHSKSTSPCLPAVIGSLIASPENLERVEHVSPACATRALWRVPLSRSVEASQAATAGRQAHDAWRRVVSLTRVERLRPLVEAVDSSRVPLAAQIVLETGKPLADARLEVTFALDLISEALRRPLADGPASTGPGWEVHRRPHGVVAVITPWNNPLAIPLGKIVPALVYGNAVVWKPALPAARVGQVVCELLQRLELPEGLVSLVQGDRTTAEMLLNHPGIDAATLTGSAAAGFSAQAICSRRSIPFQGELGGNNASLVWDPVDAGEAARRIVHGAFGAAGQRCTANRRVVVPRSELDSWVERLAAATSELVWGDPSSESTQVGPLIAQSARDRVRRVVERAVEAGHVARAPHLLQADRAGLLSEGWYYPPTIVVCGDAGAEIVQEETFGPVLVVQPADSWEHALALCDGVRQGLVSAVWTRSEERQRQFLDEIRAGILKVNQSTAGATGEAPFGGWKTSGVGPPEHGAADAEFYTRSQTVYHTGVLHAESPQRIRDDTRTVG